MRQLKLLEEHAVIDVLPKDFNAAKQVLDFLVHLLLVLVDQILLDYFSLIEPQEASQHEHEVRKEVLHELRTRWNVHSVQAHDFGVDELLHIDDALEYFVGNLFAFQVGEKHVTQQWDFKSSHQLLVVSRVLRKLVVVTKLVGHREYFECILQRDYRSQATLILKHPFFSDRAGEEDLNQRCVINVWLVFVVAHLVLMGREVKLMLDCHLLHVLVSCLHLALSQPEDIVLIGRVE